MRLLFLAILCSLAFATAAPIVHSVVLRNGNGSVAYVNSTAMLDWHLENPDDMERRILLQAQATTGKSSGLFIKELVIPPGSKEHGTSYIVLNDGNEYLIEAFWEGKQIYKDKVLVPLASPAGVKIAIYNDSFKLEGYSRLQKMKEQPHRMIFSMFSAENAPDHWAALEEYGAVMLIEPDFSFYSLPQLGAVADYVQMGGELIIASPSAAISMAGTPLENMLPFKPVSLHQEESYGPLAKVLKIKGWRTIPEYGKDGCPMRVEQPLFLDTLPLEGANTLLADKERLYAAMKPVGAGVVIGFSFNLFDATQSDDLFTLPLWNMLLSNCNFQADIMKTYDITPCNSCLQLLHGYSIPSIHTIVTILGSYLIGIALILLICRRKGRHALGWGIACFYGIILTVAVMFSSSGISRSKTDLAMANIRVSLWDGAPGAAKNNSMILSTKDIRPNVSASSRTVFMRQQPERESRLYTAKKSVTINKTPLSIADDGKELRLEKFTLQQSQPRTLQWLEKKSGYAAHVEHLPIMNIDPLGVKVADWTLPDELKSYKRALFLSYNRKVRSLEMRDGIVCDTEKTQLLEADTALLSLMEYLQALPLKSPVIALVKSGKAELQQPLKLTIEEGSVGMFEYDVVLVPLRMPSLQELNAIPADFITWTIPNNSPLRSSYVNGEWHSMNCIGTAGAEYRILFHAMPGCAHSSPKEISVSLDISLPDQNMECKAYMIDLQGHILEPEAHNGNDFIFHPSGREIIGAVDGNFTFAFQLVSKRTIAVDSARNNTWRINAISARIVNND